MDPSIDWFLFPQDAYLTNLLSWLGNPYPLEISQRLVRAVAKQQPGACLLAMQCLERPDLQTFSQPGGRITQVTATFLLSLLVTDARQRVWWQKASVVINGQRLDQPEQTAICLDVRVLESQLLAPDGKILVERLKSGLWLERSQLLLPWSASPQRLSELGGRAVIAADEQVELIWRDESALGGISGSVTAQFASSQSRLSAFILRPPVLTQTLSLGNEFFTEWLRLVEHFGPPTVSKPDESYRWQLGPVNLWLSGRRAGDQTKKYIRLERSAAR